MTDEIRQKDDLVYEKVIGILQNMISLAEVLKDRNHKNFKTNNLEKSNNSLEDGFEASGKRLILATKWSNYYEYPTIGTLRALIFNQHKNGFHKVIRRVGGRILLKEDEFFKWVEETNSN